MSRHIRRCCAILLATGILSGCADEYEQQFEAFDVHKLKQGTAAPIETMLPGAWDVVCITNSGSQPIEIIESSLPDLKADWLQDPKLHKSDYPDAFFKLTLFNKNDFKIVILNKNEGTFDAEGCFRYRGAVVRVEHKLSPNKNSPVPIKFVDPEPACPYSRTTCDADFLQKQ